MRNVFCNLQPYCSMSNLDIIKHVVIIRLLIQKQLLVLVYTKHIFMTWDDKFDLMICLPGGRTGCGSPKVVSSVFEHAWKLACGDTCRKSKSCHGRVSLKGISQFMTFRNSQKYICTWINEVYKIKRFRMTLLRCCMLLLTRFGFISACRPAESIDINTEFLFKKHEICIKNFFITGCWGAWSNKQQRWRPSRCPSCPCKVIYSHELKQIRRSLP